MYKVAGSASTWPPFASQDFARLGTELGPPRKTLDLGYRMVEVLKQKQFAAHRQ